MMKTKEMPILGFVLLQMTKQNDMIPDIEVKVHHEIINTRKITIHKTDIALHPEIDSVITKVLLLHKTLEHDITTIK